MKYMTKEWYAQEQIVHRTYPFDKKAEEKLSMVVSAYTEEYEKNFSTPPEFMETIDRLHDCDLVSAELVGTDFVITIVDGEWDIDGYTKIILKNVVLKKMDFDNQRLGWCYQELYPTDLGYELHVLFFEYGSDEMYDLIAECENIEIENVMKLF